MSLFEDWLAQAHPPAPQPAAPRAPVAGGPFESIEEAEADLGAMPEEAFGDLDEDYDPLDDEDEEEADE